MTGKPTTWCGKIGNRAASEEKDLNRALVAGLMLEVILDHPGLPEDPRSRRRQVKSRLKTTLVSRLAGHIPLQSFRDLARNLDRWFDFFYPLITARGVPAEIGPKPGGDSTASGLRVRDDLLREALEHLNGLLPMRRHRKLDRHLLFEFLRRTGGDWFRLKDLEGFFHIDRKTAWEYIRKLLQAELLCHNQGRSAAVRYRLAPKFSGR